MRYHVIETDCFPCKWKVESIQFPGRDNSTHLYKKTVEEANALCDYLNALEEKRDQSDTQYMVRGREVRVRR